MAAKGVIKGFDISNIEAKRFTKTGEKIQNLRIDHNSTVSMVTQIEDDVAALDFRFTANYVSVGMIKLEGRVIWKGEVGELVSEWSKTNNMPQEIASQIHTAIISHCMPAAVVIARDIGLPPPLPPIPPIQMMKKPSSGKDRRQSPEVV